MRTGILLSIAGLLLLTESGSPQPPAPGASSPPVSLEPAGIFGELPKDVPSPGPIVAITVTAEGAVALLESESHRILLFDADGSWNGEAGGFGFDNGSLRSTGDLAAIGFELWAPDPLAGQIVRYDSWLAPLEPFKEVANGPNKLDLERPNSVARLPQGDLFVLEADRGDGLMIDPEGRLIERVASFGQTGITLETPQRVEALGSDGFAIADPGLGKAVLLDRFGTLRGIRQWPFEGTGPLGLAATEQRLWLCGEGGVIVYDSVGREQGRWDTSFFNGNVNDIAIRGNQLLVAVGSTVQRFQINTPGLR